jgi:hypothetical protein
MIFKPVVNPVRWEGVAVCAWVLLGQLLLAQWVLNRSTDWLRFALAAILLLSVPVLLHLAYRTWIAFSLEYWLDRNSLTMRCADVRQVIPLGTLKRVLLGSDESAEPLTARQMWAAWPSSYVGSKRMGADEVAVFANQPLAQCLLLETGATTWGLSPEEPAAFIEAVQQRVRQGPVAAVAESFERRFDPAGFLNVDRFGLMLIGLGLLGGALVLGIFMVRFPGLPDVLTVAFTGEGMPEVVREKQSLFVLPILAMLAWVVNGVGGMLMAGRRQLPAAYLLWGGTLVVQVCALAALIGLIGWM